MSLTGSGRCLEAIIPGYTPSRGNMTPMVCSGVIGAWVAKIGFKPTTDVSVVNLGCDKIDI